MCAERACVRDDFDAIFLASLTILICARVCACVCADGECAAAAVVLRGH